MGRLILGLGRLGIIGFVGAQGHGLPASAHGVSHSQLLIFFFPNVTALKTSFPEQMNPIQIHRGVCIL